MSENKRYRTSVRDVNGNTKTISAKTKKELDKKVREFYNARDNGLQVYEKAYFKEWAQKWYDDNEINKAVGYSQADIYERNIRVLNTRYANVELKDIKCSDFNNFIKHYVNTKYVFDANGNYTEIERDKPVSKSATKKLIQTARLIFRYAIANDIPATDFFSSVKIPTNATQNERRALTEYEQQWIIDTPHRCQLPAMIMLFSGVRRGELLALTWQDIDLQKGVISITKTYDVKTRTIKDGGKTENATRQIPIPQILIDYLSDYKSKLKVVNVHGYVCTDAKGKQFSETGFRRMWESYLRDLNVKYGYSKQNVSKYNPNGLPMRIDKFTPHYLRHTFATILFLQGVDVIDAMQYMGHADIQTTINIYTDLKGFNKLTVSDDYKLKLKTEYKIMSA